MEMLAVEAAPVNLRSDNVAGIAPEILAAIEAANAGTAPSVRRRPDHRAPPGRLRRAVRNPLFRAAGGDRDRYATRSRWR